MNIQYKSLRLGGLVFYNEGHGKIWPAIIVNFHRIPDKSPDDYMPLLDLVVLMTGFHSPFMGRTGISCGRQANQYMEWKDLNEVVKIPEAGMTDDQKKHLELLETLAAKNNIHSPILPPA